MLTKSKWFKILFIKIYNFSGIFAIKIQKNELKTSKLQAVWNCLKFIFVGIAITMTIISYEFSEEIFSIEVTELPYTSLFSRIIVRVDTHVFTFTGFAIIFLQAFKCKAITEFIDRITKNDPLDLLFADKYKIQSLKNLIYQLIILASVIIFEILTFTRNDRFWSMLINFVFCYYYVPAIGLMNFFYNFKIFLVTNLQQIRKNLERCLIKNEQNIIGDNLYEIMKVAEILKKFHEIFEDQLNILLIFNTTQATIMTYNFVQNIPLNYDAKFNITYFIYCIPYFFFLRAYIGNLAEEFLNERKRLIEIICEKYFQAKESDKILVNFYSNMYKLENFKLFEEETF
ncbi:hypothetical protein PVAND_013225 [Polypedilum vanderplanki]|uniref:Uncharacterized protein n=1 Tax=Polypedilum vanderplanki TaxID=319348 RepID=A0A9J6CNV1_POLVA|nr:hypothetical protein PVAND_013225 [Polypedilum vanderplanki]